jgi:hypothetical protein
MNTTSCEVAVAPPVLESAWAMPNTNTFRIPPIAELLRLFVGRGDGWADSFGGSNSPAQHQNGMNGRNRGETTTFLERFPDESLQGVILDPSCRPHPTNESGAGTALTNNGGSFIGQVKDVTANCGCTNGEASIRTPTMKTKGSQLLWNFALIESCPMTVR